ncbi:unnamed protein product, partial [Ixodes pacificus]
DVKNGHGLLVTTYSGLQSPQSTARRQTARRQTARRQTPVDKQPVDER